MFAVRLPYKESWRCVTEVPIFHITVAYGVKETYFCQERRGRKMAKVTQRGKVFLREKRTSKLPVEGGFSYSATQVRPQPRKWPKRPTTIDVNPVVEKFDNSGVQKRYGLATG